MEEQNNNQYPNGTDNQNGVYYQPPAENNTTQNYYQPPADNGGVYQSSVPQPEPPKKKSKAGKIIGIIVGVIVVVFVALFVIGMLSDETEPDSPAATQAEETETATEKTAKNDIQFGVYTDDTYTNAFAGFGIKLPDSGWKFLKDEDIKTLLAGNNPQTNENGKVYIDSEAEKAYYDMMLMNDATGTNIQVVLSEASVAAGIITSEDLYIKNAVAGIGDSAVASDAYDLTVAGEKYRAIDLDYTSYGTKQTIAVRKVGKNFVGIIITVYSSTDSNACSYYADMFYNL